MKYIFIVLLIMPVTLAAQEHDRVTTAVAAHSIRVSPFHLFNFYPTVQVGYEARIYRRIGLYVEGGVAVNYDNNDNAFLNKRGGKFKLEPRYYALLNERGNVLWYLASEFYYNHINFDRISYSNECYDVDCTIQFRRRNEYSGGYREKGFGVKWGMMIGGRRLFLDVSGGLAVRGINYLLPETPWLDEINDGWFDVPDETDRTVMGPLLGIRAGWRLKR